MVSIRENILMSIREEIKHCSYQGAGSERESAARGLASPTKLDYQPEQNLTARVASEYTLAVPSTVSNIPPTLVLSRENCIYVLHKLPDLIFGIPRHLERSHCPRL